MSETSDLCVRVIACLDVDHGKVVKGVNFENLKEIGDPVEMAKKYDKAGTDELCFLDVTASSEARDIFYNEINKVAKNCFIPLCVGGGIKTVEDVRKLLLAGADKVSIGSSAVANPDLISEIADIFGSQCVIVSLDIKRENGQFIVYTHGGRKSTGIEAISFAKHMEAKGAGEILINSIDKDGSKSGFDHELNLAISSVTTIPIIASGGAGKIEHFPEAVKKGKVDAVLAASVFHFDEMTIDQVKAEMKKENINVRI